MDSQPPDHETQATEERPARRTETLGVRMTTDRVREVKVEAAVRGMSVASLFEEMWQAYRAGRGA